MITIVRRNHMGPARNQRQKRTPPWAPVVGLFVVGLLVVVLAAWVWSGMHGAANEAFEQITDSMPRQQVESILGAGTVVVSRVEHIGATSAKIEVLEWQAANGQQRIRIEFVDDQVLTKTVHEH
ncbi:MAG: hypothetical protein K8T91_13330 [Planctomycetes bacterium]|nr:hypothetical protein [Planctomycetota bacterium]